MKILIDADACPRSVLQICQRRGREAGWEVWTVASFNHVIDNEQHITVGDGGQETDLKVLNLTAAGDIVITQDWGLAAMILGKTVWCLSPGGRRFEAGSIDFLLEEREAKAKYRRGGGRTRGPKGRTPADDERFEAALLRLLREAAGEAKG